LVLAWHRSAWPRTSRVRPDHIVKLVARENEGHIRSPKRMGASSFALLAEDRALLPAFADASARSPSRRMGVPVVEGKDTAQALSGD
jgi:hypothetical protein